MHQCRKTRLKSVMCGIIIVHNVKVVHTPTAVVVLLLLSHQPRQRAAGM